MKISRVLGYAVNWAVVAIGSLGLACGSDGTDEAGVVSCDIVEGGLHYCKEAASSSDVDTGCPDDVDGYTPGTGCSREDVAGTCTEGPYSFYLYEGSSTASDVLSSICPGGGLVPGDPTEDTTGSSTCTISYDGEKLYCFSYEPDATAALCGAVWGVADVEAVSSCPEGNVIGKCIVTGSMVDHERLYYKSLSGMSTCEDARDNCTNMNGALGEGVIVTFEEVNCDEA